ncbi:MAG: DNA polymerase III subunit delta [Gammaproteobacteria bacterium]|nr:DNA polymerase III subunit delta [Gammaproteobacteria bacterium]
MRLRNDQLPTHLEKSLVPVYFLSGDEPLQMGEAADLIRARARAQGHTEREVLEHAAGFDWGLLSNAADSMSLFGERRILDLRLNSAKVGTEGAKALTSFAANPPPDTLLLITAPKLERNQLNSKWVKVLDQAGVLVQIWPVEGNRLPPWIEQRLRKAGLIPETGVVEMLVERVEGNLLAANQEIEKLLLLYGPGVVTIEQLGEAVADSARFDVFGLVDSLLLGEPSRGLRMLQGLRAEGVASPVVLWAFTREIRALAEMAFEVEQGANAERIMAGQRIWEKRKPLIRRGLRQSSDHWRRLLEACARTDRLIKGLGCEDPWLHLQDIALGLAGVCDQGR